MVTEICSHLILGFNLHLIDYNFIGLFAPPHWWCVVNCYSNDFPTYPHLVSLDLEFGLRDLLLLYYFATSNMAPKKHKPINALNSVLSPGDMPSTSSSFKNQCFVGKYSQ